MIIILDEETVILSNKDPDQNYVDELFHNDDLLILLCTM